MPVAKAQVVFQGSSGLPKDRFINTFHFACDAFTDTVGASIASRLRAFYNTNIGDYDLAHFMGQAIQRGFDQAQVRLYDEAPNALPPWYVDLWTLDNAGVGTTPLPDEASVVLSFKNDSVTTTPARNRRGRIYLGPLNSDAGQATDGVLRVNPNLIATLTGAADALLAENDVNAIWVIWSKVLGQSFPVENGWVDNRIDTQRRRARVATTRTVWS